MDYLLFIAWLVGIAWLITRIKFFSQTGLSRAQLVSIFLLKVMAGIFYGWTGIYYGGLAKMQDTWTFHFMGIEEYRLLFNHPREYFSNTFYDPYGGGFMKFLSGTDSFWNDLKGNIFIKILSVFDILSTGNYYVNVIFYAALTLVGPLAFYRVMYDLYPQRKNTLLVGIFLVPSFIYWTSGLHKEGLLFTGISLLVYSIYFSQKQKKLNWKRGISLLVGLLLLLSLRNFIFLLVFPAIIAWLLANRQPQRSLFWFSLTYGICLLLFFSLPYLDRRLDFPQAVVNKQQDFIKLQPGGSTINISELEPNAGSFLRNTPQAINLSMLRPNPGDVRHLLSLAAAIEINVLLLLFLLFLFFRVRPAQPRPVLFFTFFFSLSLLLAIGFTSNNLGAIVRYRSIVIPLLVVPMLIRIDWQRLNRVLKFSN